MADVRKPSKSTGGPSPSRIIIEGLQPELDGGRFPIKRTVGEVVAVSVDIFAEGHDLLNARILHRKVGSTTWQSAPLRMLVNDRWSGQFEAEGLGRYEYTVEGWIDRFGTWRRDLGKKVEASQEVDSELLEGADLIRNAAALASGEPAAWLRSRADEIAGKGDSTDRAMLALDPELAGTIDQYPDRTGSFVYPKNLSLMVERERARFGSWYEMFPRSCAPEPGQHGTLTDARERLPYVASMGFDVLYLPPIHPIGRAFRKGPNNTLTPGPDDPGSPWAIGGPEGGHKSVHPDLGTIDDFDALVKAAAGLGIEVSLDIAFQCSPDHPYVKEHPEWFRKRPDGTIKYAENPPKKYQDIYPIDFETEAWESLYAELLDVFLFWVGHGVTIFRVDNPHTKPFRFWEWCLKEVWDRHPETIFLSEAFTRPKVMKQLAKLGYTQSYSYFTWRTNKQGLTEYFSELYHTDVVEYLRPNLFANTPDILHESLQHGGRPAFMTRFVLAATLGASYGIYGPTFELCDGTAVRPGSEEYLDSEKYQVRHWNLDQPQSLKTYIAKVNQVRRENPALQDNRGLRFVATDNEAIICYAKMTSDRSNVVIVAVNLDPYHTQSAWIHLPMETLGLPMGPEDSFEVHEVLGDARYLWRGASNFIILDPFVSPSQIFVARRKIKTERDFDAYQ